MTTAFVAGATGYTGREVVAELAARGVSPVAHVRPDSSALNAWRERFDALGAEVDTAAWEPRAMAETLARRAPDAVFCLIGTTRKRGDTYEAIDFGLTKLLVDAAATLASPPSFIYLSSVGASPSAGSAYLRARGQAEAAVRASGVPFVIARPSFITGPDRDESRPAERAGAAVADAALALVGALGARRARDRYRSMTGAELAAGMVSLALDPAARGRIVDAEELRSRA